MRHIQVFFGEDGTPVASERVENDHEDLSLEFTCQKCGQMNRLDLEAAHKQLPTTINCKSGCVVTVRLHKEHEDQDYLLQVAAVEPNSEGLIPMIFHQSDELEYKVSVGKWLAPVEHKPGEKAGEDSVSSTAALLWKALDGTYTIVTRVIRNSDAGNRNFWEAFSPYRSAKDVVVVTLGTLESWSRCGLDISILSLWYGLIKEAAKKDACLADAMNHRDIYIQYRYRED
jgi:hypothetical protein